MINAAVIALLVLINALLMAALAATLMVAYEAYRDNKERDND